MMKPTKTIRMITWPDGRQVKLQRAHGGWQWTTLKGHGAGSSHLDSALLSIKREGGKVEIVPNPHYEAQMESYELRRRDRALSRFWDGLLVGKPGRRMTVKGR